MAKKRVDLLLVEQGLAESRALAQRLIMAGQVRADGQVIVKASEKVLTTANTTGKKNRRSKASQSIWVSISLKCRHATRLPFGSSLVTSTTQSFGAHCLVS